MWLDYTSAKAIYLLGYLFMIAWLGSSRLTYRKNVSQQLKKVAIFNDKSLMLFFSSRTFFFSLINSFFFYLDCQNLAVLGFDNHPDLKRETLDSGKENISLRKETSFASFFLSDQRFSGYQEYIFLNYGQFVRVIPWL